MIIPGTRPKVASRISKHSTGRMEKDDWFVVVQDKNKNNINQKHNGEDDDSDSSNDEAVAVVVWRMRESRSFADLVVAAAAASSNIGDGGYHWTEAVSHVTASSANGAVVVFTTDECCWTLGPSAVVADEVPGAFRYHLDLTIVAAAASDDDRDDAHNKIDKKKDRVVVHIAALNSHAAANTLSCWLSWLSLPLSSSTPSSTASSSVAATTTATAAWNNLGLDVTVKAFAAQPRQSFPPLAPILLPPDTDNAFSSIVCLRWHFLSFPAEMNVSTALSSIGRRIRNMEFVQCTTPPNNVDPDNATGGDSDADILVQCSTSLWNTVLYSPQLMIETVTISCTMPELIKLVPSLGEGGRAVAASHLTELRLVLHFMLGGEALEKLCAALRHQSRTATNTTNYWSKVSIQYLDLSDEGWVMLLSSLHHHPSLQQLSLLYTENFVDAYRRLTVERRRSRSQAVLDLIRSCPRLHTVAWPTFQHDIDDDASSVMSDIETALQANQVAACVPTTLNM